jgi:hypothetical protein
MTSFLDFVSAAGNNLISEWYCSQPVECRAMFDDLLDILAKKAAWKYPEFKRLENGLGEIMWRFGKVQHRMIGCSWKAPSGYLLLIGCTHKQDIYNPPDAIETADKRRRGLLFERKGSVCEHASPEDCAPSQQRVP